MNYWFSRCKNSLGINILSRKVVDLPGKSYNWESTTPAFEKYKVDSLKGLLIGWCFFDWEGF